MKKIVLIILSLAIATGPLTARDLLAPKKSLTQKVKNFISDHPKLIIITACVSIAALLIYKSKQNRKQYAEFRAKRAKKEETRNKKLKKAYEEERQRVRAEGARREQESQDKLRKLKEEQEQREQKRQEKSKLARKQSEANHEQQRKKQKKLNKKEKKRQRRQQLHAKRFDKATAGIEQIAQEVNQSKRLYSRLGIEPNATCLEKLGFVAGTTVTEEQVLNNYKELCELYDPATCSLGKEIGEEAVKLFTQARDEALKKMNPVDELGCVHQ